MVCVMQVAYCIKPFDNEEEEEGCVCEFPVHMKLRSLDVCDSTTYVFDQGRALYIMCSTL